VVFLSDSYRRLKGESKKRKAEFIRPKAIGNQFQSISTRGKIILT